MRLAIAGGTGVVGRHVVAAAKAAGHEPVVLARSTGVDLVRGEGIEAAIAGCDAVIEVTSVGTGESRVSVDFFTAVTERLLAAERVAGVRHHVALSIVGAAVADDGYYAGKAAQERILMAEPDGWTVLRATQFHEFAPQLLRRPTTLGMHLVPRMRSQPIAAAEVGTALVEIAVGPPRGLDRELAGPREEWMPDLVRRYLRATGGRGPVVTVPMPGRMGRALRDGTILPGPDAVLGRQTFDEWLAAVEPAPRVP